MTWRNFRAYQSNRSDVSYCPLWQAKRQSALAAQRTRVTSFMTQELQAALGIVLLDKVSTPSRQSIDWLLSDGTNLHPFTPIGSKTNPKFYGKISGSRLSPVINN